MRETPQPRPNPALHHYEVAPPRLIDRVMFWFIALISAVATLEWVALIWLSTCGMGVAC